MELVTSMKRVSVIVFPLASVNGNIRYRFRTRTHQMGTNVQHENKEAFLAVSRGVRGRFGSVICQNSYPNQTS